MPSPVDSHLSIASLCAKGKFCFNGGGTDNVISFVVVSMVMVVEVSQSSTLKAIKVLLQSPTEDFLPENKVVVGISQSDTKFPKVFHTENGFVSPFPEANWSEVNSFIRPLVVNPT